MRVGNPPLALLALLGWAATVPGFLGLSPNRLAGGREIAIWAVVSPAGQGLVAACLAALAAAALVRPSAAVRSWTLGVACAGLLLVLAGAGDGAARLLRHASPAARASLGPGFWLMQFAFALAAVDALRALEAGAVLRLGTACLVLAAMLGLALSGLLDPLSLARELATHRQAFAAALLRHLLLVGCTLAIALAAGVPAGILLARHRAWRGPVFTVLNVVQTIPSVALFGLLIAPLSAIGLSGIGTVPALVALVLYALLPVVRNTVAGLDGADPATLEAARGMGMSQHQVLLRVALPLAAPALLAGLRLVSVQTIGLAVVAALIGAGGLGDFVFQGLGQYAIDLVLLGALPAIGLALTADLLLQLAAKPLRGLLA